MSKKKVPSLIIEHVSDKGNLQLLSLLEYRRDRYLDRYLVIVDNIDEELITAYVLDYAQQEGVDLCGFIKLAEDWLSSSNGTHPFSFELSRLGLTSATRRIYKTFDLSYVTRLIGRSFKFDLTTPLKVRRRRAAQVPAGIEIKPKASIHVLQPAVKHVITSSSKLI